MIKFSQYRISQLGTIWRLDKTRNTSNKSKYKRALRFSAQSKLFVALNVNNKGFALFVYRYQIRFHYL